jgi:hypothetical protein
VGRARRTAPGPAHRNRTLTANRTKELRELGHVPTPPRPQTGFARGRLSPKSRPHLFMDDLFALALGSQEGLSSSRRLLGV